MHLQTDAGVTPWQMHGRAVGDTRAATNLQGSKEWAGSTVRSSAWCLQHPSVASLQLHARRPISCTMGTPGPGLACEWMPGVPPSTMVEGHACAGCASTRQLHTMHGTTGEVLQLVPQRKVGHRSWWLWPALRGELVAFPRRWFRLRLQQCPCMMPASQQQAAREVISIRR